MGRMGSYIRPMARDAGPAVLVAEDNPVARALICSYLEALGIFPDAAAHGREALDAYRSRPYDLIFMDCRMPVMDGMAAAREIRVLEAAGGRRVRIVGMSDEPGAGGMRVIPAAMDALIATPGDGGDFREQVDIVLRDRRRE